jgi:hypothetical protein
MQDNEVYYTQSFISQHSPQGAAVLEELRVELLAYKKLNNEEEQCLEELAYIDRNDFDLCDEVSNRSLQ